MFVEIGKDEFLNLEHVVSFQLVEDIHEKGKFWWGFYTTGTSIGLVSSGFFKTKEDALKWFKDNIEPALKDYNKSRESLFEIATFLDTLPERINKALKGEKI